MNKKFLSAILFGALMVTSTGTFVSCKDYDDDIDAINKELTDVKSQIAALQAKVDAGKWITSVSSNAAGVTINLSDGSSVNITNGKDGAQGAAGQDGKNGTVVTVNENGVLCLDGVETAIKVAEEAPAAKNCVKFEGDELYILDENEEWVATGITACGVKAVKENGVWTITTADGESIVVPGFATLTSISIESASNLIFNYGKVAKAKAWGWTEDGKTFDEEMEAGFYTRLNQDVDVLLNPAEADGTAFTYTFKNSKGEAADVTFFGEARPSTAVLTKAVSANGLWTLPAEVSKFDATSINEMRNELYLKFKQNDGNAYLLTLEAADLLGNTVVRSGYDYTITLQEARGGASIDNMKNCEIGQVYYPAIVGPVYDYKIRVKQDAKNLRLAKAFGIDVIDDKGFIANNDAAVLNAIQFEYTYVTIKGDASYNNVFSVTFTDGMSASENLRADEWTASLDAARAYSTVKPYAPSEIASRLINNTDKVFLISHDYDLSTLYAGLSDEAKLLFDESINNFELTEKELIGGESSTGNENYNQWQRNDLLAKNIYWTYDPSKKLMNVRFYVSENFQEKYGDHVYNKDTEGDWWVEQTNFQLETAYQLNISVLDAWNGNEVALIELPFEFKQPTMDITRPNGKFSEWANDYAIDWNADNTVKKAEDALYVYGVMGLDGTGNAVSNDMFLPLYDSFNAWKPESTTIAEFEEYVDNAEYYKLYFNGVQSVRILDAVNSQNPGDDFEKSLETLDYTAIYSKLGTFARTAAIDEWKALTWRHNGKQKEVAVPMHVEYNHYGVYPAFNSNIFTDEWDATGNRHYDENPWNTTNWASGDFYLVFASWLNHSTLKMKEASYTTAPGTHHVFITNDDLNFTTPMDDPFYLFDGISAAGKVVERADLNINAFNEIEQHPFTTVTGLFSNIANFTVKEAAGSQETVACRFGTSSISVAYDEETGKAELDLSNLSVEDDEVRFYNVPSVAKEQDTDIVAGYKQAFKGGMLITLPKSVQDGQSVIVTVTLEDNWGYMNSFDIKIKKLR